MSQQHDQHETQEARGGSQPLAERQDLPRPATGSSEEIMPCHTCALIDGTEANRTEHTRALFEACVEGITPFYCHERPDICRGWVGAVNARWAGEDLESDANRRHIDVFRMGAELIGGCIQAAKDEDDQRTAVSG